jgi:sterol desaturase/sphingolipid hydroxylase (fatty acid hydroxylase superfamily)
MRRFLFLTAWLSMLLLLERRRPLRRPMDSGASRLVLNSTVGLISGTVLSLTEMPATRLAARMVEQRGLGLIQRRRLPQFAEAIASFILLDYSIYLWHVLLHKVPLLWRFHVAHHIDRDLDTSTALRFHFGELFFSMFWRVGTITALGIRPKYLFAWETFLIAEIMFHHSNVRLPLGLERALNKIVVTPRMHGVHHSIIERETNSNWSSGLTVWDYLHGTLRLNVHQDYIAIGVPAYRAKEETSFVRTLALPFMPQRDAWRFVHGKEPVRYLAPNEGQPKRKLIA